MDNTDKIRKMYSQITAPKSAVEECIEHANNSRTVRFPSKRIIAVSICAAVLLAVALPVGANKVYDAFSELDALNQMYKETYPEKNYPDYGNISQNASVIENGNKLSSSAEGLNVYFEKAYYDGTFLYLSFSGDYNGDLKNAERFDYCDYEGIYKDDILINGKRNTPSLSNYNFSLIKTENGFSGTMGFVCNEDAESLDVQINIPFLNVNTFDADEEPPIGVIEEDLTFSFRVDKSYDDVLKYTSDSDNEEVCVKEIVSSCGGVKVTLFVKNNSELSKSKIMSEVKNNDGESALFILGEDKDTEDGTYITRYYAPLEGDVLNITLYGAESDKEPVTVSANLKSAE